LTASPVYDEVLPTIANPPSPYKSIGYNAMWRSYGSPQSRYHHSRYFYRYWRQGIKEQIVTDHEGLNSILMGYSNKGHEGYLGDSIIGYWCNLGAGTCNSNIKNTAGSIQMWNEAKQIWDTIGQKMGMLVGDYSRFAIQSSINTGSYIGVSANIFGNGLLPKNIPNFTWGVLPGYQFEKVIEDLQNWKKLKGSTISEEEQQILLHLHHLSA
jgi:NDP-sugar pyrophosphorylase family protein